MDEDEDGGEEAMCCRVEYESAGEEEDK